MILVVGFVVWVYVWNFSFCDWTEFFIRIILWLKVVGFELWFKNKFCFFVFVNILFCLMWLIVMINYYIKNKWEY